MKWTYLLLNLGTVFIPFLLSFEKRVQFHKKWRPLFPAILIVGLVFLIWDICFQKWGIWSFNYDYTLGPKYLGLPLEEYLFFLCIPFACVFIYEVLRYFKPHSTFDKYAKKVLMFIAVLSAVLGAIYLHNTYSAVNYIANALILYLIATSNPKWLGLFLRAFGIMLLPFFVVNGVLTALPVVQYNNAENLGLRLGTIPIEDVSYALLLLLSVVFLYEYFKRNYESQ